MDADGLGQRSPRDSAGAARSQHQQAQQHQRRMSAHTASPSAAGPSGQTQHAAPSTMPRPGPGEAAAGGVHAATAHGAPSMMATGGMDSISPRARYASEHARAPRRLRRLPTPPGHAQVSQSDLWRRRYCDDHQALQHCTVIAAPCCRAATEAAWAGRTWGGAGAALLRRHLRRPQPAPAAQRRDVRHAARRRVRQPRGAPASALFGCRLQGLGVPVNSNHHAVLGLCHTLPDSGCTITRL
jgi:hypothetical protein